MAFCNAVGKISNWLTCCCCFDEQCILFCESEMVLVICASRFQRIPTYPIQMNAS
jgi:hypothetical protein